MSRRFLALAGMAALMSIPPAAGAKKPIELAGVSCQNPPPMHCPDKDCPAPLVIEQGNATEPQTNRKFFLDYPCDLKKNEKVTFILSLHGAGGYGNWQRHYFPMFDYKDKYRLVIATPNAPPRVWTDADDTYLQNIVTMMFRAIGEKNVKAFWLVGHSQGGMTSNRLVRTPFFKEKADGWLSLSGGRLGGSPGRAGSFGPPRMPNAAPGNAAANPVPAGPTSGNTAAAAPAAAAPPRPATPNMAAAMAALREPPQADISFIFTTGQREMDDKGVPGSSTWAEKYGCGPREKLPDVVDTKAGYVYDGTRQNPPNPAWGLLPAPGRAEVYRYPACQGGRIVADVVRIDKGHTEGLEPRVTEELIRLMLSAKK